MNKSQNGGPAFGFASGDLVSTGITTRDYFAAAALHGLCANPKKCELSSMEMAEEAYRKADSMLQERQIENEIGGAA